MVGRRCFGAVSNRAHTAGEIRFADHLLQGDVRGNELPDFLVHVSATPKPTDHIL